MDLGSVLWRGYIKLFCPLKRGTKKAPLSPVPYGLETFIMDITAKHIWSLFQTIIFLSHLCIADEALSTVVLSSCVDRHQQEGCKMFWNKYYELMQNIRSVSSPTNWLLLFNFHHYKFFTVDLSPLNQVTIGRGIHSLQQSNESSVWMEIYILNKKNCR